MGNASTFGSNLPLAPFWRGDYTLACNRIGYSTSSGLTSPEADAAAAVAAAEMSANYLRFPPAQTHVLGYLMGGFAASVTGQDFVKWIFLQSSTVPL